MQMDARYYCDSMYSELTGLKAHIYNIVRHMDMASEEERRKLGPEISDLYGLVDALTEKINRLNQECPADWNAQREEIETKKAEIVGKIDYWDREHISPGFLGG